MCFHFSHLLYFTDIQYKNAYKWLCSIYIYRIVVAIRRATTYYELRSSVKEKMYTRCKSKRSNRKMLMRTKKCERVKDMMNCLCVLSSVYARDITHLKLYICKRKWKCVVNHIIFFLFTYYNAPQLTVPSLIFFLVRISILYNYYCRTRFNSKSHTLKRY